MESLSDTEWDVTISGTGLAQSLLALALSRSGKKVLHVDKNPYYGGPEAAFSLQEAEKWAKRISNEPRRDPFEDASVYIPSDIPEQAGALSKSRNYTLSLSPALIYARSRLIPNLVASKVYRQLEFQAVGSWWIYRRNSTAGNTGGKCLQRVPSSREDIFSDDTIGMKSKRMAIKFLRNIVNPSSEGDNGTSPIQPNLHLPLPDYLSTNFQVPAELHDPLLSLSMSQRSLVETNADFAIPRITRHITSIGVFGPGFGSLLTKWGGGSEIAQVACRALAVGGGVYVLNKGVQSIQLEASNDDKGLLVQLSDGETIRSKFVVGSAWDLPAAENTRMPSMTKVSRSISIVSSPLESLFPVTAEGGPIPAGAVVFVPGEELAEGNTTPVYLLVHSSDTGECPEGQCVVYGSVAVPGEEGHTLLETAVNRLLQVFTDHYSAVAPTVLWSLRYTQLGIFDGTSGTSGEIIRSPELENVLFFPPPSLDLSFDDNILDAVQAAWKIILGDEARDDEFLRFEDRQAEVEDF